MIPQYDVANEDEAREIIKAQRERRCARCGGEMTRIETVTLQRLWFCFYCGHDEKVR